MMNAHFSAFFVSWVNADSEAKGVTRSISNDQNNATLKAGQKEDQRRMHLIGYYCAVLRVKMLTEV